MVLWTGGKDSFLALQSSRKQGITVRALVTFVPPQPSFRAHPIQLMQAQAAALQIPHRPIAITPPFDVSYSLAFRALREEGVTTLITGDIAEVDGFESWVVERANPEGLQVRRPLWHRERAGLLQEVLDERIRAVITAARDPPLGADWVGTPLDEGAVDRLRKVAKTSPLDLCGENGEYHTMVVDGPGFRAPIRLPSFTTARTGNLYCARFT